MNHGRKRVTAEEMDNWKERRRMEGINNGRNGRNGNEMGVMGHGGHRMGTEGTEWRDWTWKR